MAELYPPSWDDGIAVIYDKATAEKHPVSYPPPRPSRAATIEAWTRTRPWLWRAILDIHLVTAMGRPVSRAPRRWHRGSAPAIVTTGLTYQLDVFEPQHVLNPRLTKAPRAPTTAVRSFMTAVQHLGIPADGPGHWKFSIGAHSNPDDNTTATPDAWRQMNDLLTLIRSPLGAPLFRRTP